MNKSILYIDDEELNCMLFEALFRKEYAVQATTSIDVALRLIKEQSFDYVILDFAMPIMNGVELAKHILSIKNDCKCYIVSGYLDNTTIENALKIGIIKAYFRKPIIKEELINTLTNTI